jgi:hypothetical protein
VLGVDMFDDLPRGGAREITFGFCSFVRHSGHGSQTFDDCQSLHQAQRKSPGFKMFGPTIHTIPHGVQSSPDMNGDENASP